MKITFVLPVATMGGGLRVIAIYARLLQARGHEVWAVSQPYRAPRSRREALRRWLRIDRPKPVERFELLEFLGDRHVVLDRPRPVRATDLPDADVIIATWWQTAEWIAPLPAAKGRKAYLLQDYEIFGAEWTARVVATYRPEFRMIAVSDYIRGEIETRHGVSGITVVPNAVDLDHFNAAPRGRGDPFTVGFLYTPTTRKNVGLAIEAVTRARQRMPELKAMAFGLGQPDDQLPLPDWIDYTCRPAQTDLPGLYAACDLWLFPSDHEGFGLPILEAMACRTPVLATPAGAAPQLIDDINGRLLPPDPDAFATEILRFAALPDEMWRRASAAAHATAHGWSWEDATDRLEAILQEDIAPQGRAANVEMSAQKASIS